MKYADRRHAGRVLAAAIAAAGEVPGDVVVLGIARGGVPVALEVAAALDAVLSVAVARKVGAPGNPEYAIGAIAELGEPLLNERTIRALRIPDRYVLGAVEEARSELGRRSEVYRAGRPVPGLRDETVVVVDDGVATGSTLLAVLRSVRASDPARLICAVPVGPPDTVARLESEADLVVCPTQPPSFAAVGAWYDNFDQVGDEQVLAMLDEFTGLPEM